VIDTQPSPPTEKGAARWVPSLPATNAAMINHVVNWIAQQPFYLDNQQPNYAVGITDNHKMIVSKVGGVTSKTASMAALVNEIKNQHWWTQIEGVYLAGTFGGDGNSNHGEMCVLAAADLIGEQIVDMRCTGDNCPACAIMLAHAGVHSLNNTASGAQQGWVHPRGRMTLGSQLNNNWSGQLAELQAFNQLTPAARADFVYNRTQRAGRDPQGKIEDVA
jgi:hypothetical protein